MKRNVTIATAVFLTVVHSFASAQQFSANAPQMGATAPLPKKGPSKFYVALNGGYFFNVSPGEFPNVGPFGPYQTTAYVDPSTGTQTSVTSNKILTGSFGQGFRGGVTVGMDVNKYVSLELAFHYFKSNKNLMTQQVYYAEGGAAGAPPVLDVTSRGYVDAIDVAPAVVISPGFTHGLNPYVRFGLVVPVYGRLKIHTDGSAEGETVVGGAPYITEATFHRDEAVKPDFTLGFQGAFGLSYPVTHCLSVFVEAEYRNVPVESKSKEVTAYQETDQVINPSNGQTVQTTTVGLSSLPTAERNTNYQTTLDQNSNTPTDNPATNLHPTYKDENSPSNDLKSYINIGGLGANIGLKWRF
jgi:hypothetical protein